MAAMAPWNSSMVKQYSFLSPRLPTLPPASINISLSLTTQTNNKKLTAAATPPEKEVPVPENEILKDYPFFIEYTDGTIEVKRPPPTFIPPAIIDPSSPSSPPKTPSSISPTSPPPPLKVRLFFPAETPNLVCYHKLPIVLYFHGSGFCSRSALSPEYTNHLTAIANEAKVRAVSVEYSKFPANPPPACYNEALTSFDWVASHAGGNGPEKWINEYGDLNRVFVAGNRAGGNITHYVVSQVGKRGLTKGVNVEGAILVHPFFGGLGKDEQWLRMCVDNKGPEDPRLLPAAEDLNKLGCERVLVCVANDTDELRQAGLNYVDSLEKSSWNGKVEKEEHDIGHSDQVYYKPYEETSLAVLKRIASFISNKQ